MTKDYYRIDRCYNVVKNVISNYIKNDYDVNYNNLPYVSLEVAIVNAIDNIKLMTIEQRSNVYARLDDVLNKDTLALYESVKNTLPLTDLLHCITYDALKEMF